MLNIIFGDCEESIYNTDVFFDNTFDSEWLNDEFAKKVIYAIDKSEVAGPNAINSPYLGVIPPEKLAGGTKTLLLIRNLPDMIFNASTCGDNCAPFILELAKDRDITINLRHLMDFGKNCFEATILNDNAVVTNMKEMMSVAFKYI